MRNNETKRYQLGIHFYRKCSCGAYIGSRKSIRNHRIKGHSVDLQKHFITEEEVKETRRKIDRLIAV
jgi:hypothetical protein